jgi:prepilin-type N-terminal cleavage/methylation domain-containing protein
MKIQDRSTEAHDRSPKSKIENGFTLIEIVISVTLLALIATTLYGAFYLGHRALLAAQARSEENQRLRSAGDLLAGYVRSAYPYRLKREDPSVRFSGEESSLSFVSALSSGMGGRGMSQIRIWHEEGEGTGALALEEKIPLGAAAEEEGGYRNKVLLDQGITALRLEYLDPQGADERWVERWDGKEKRILPRAVRLRYYASSGEEIEWVFPIMMSVLSP